jgi:hypothetical protein
VFKRPEVSGAVFARNTIAQGLRRSFTAVSE